MARECPIENYPNHAKSKDISKTGAYVSFGSLLCHLSRALAKAKHRRYIRMRCFVCECIRAEAVQLSFLFLLLSFQGTGTKLHAAAAAPITSSVAIIIAIVVADALPQHVAHGSPELLPHLELPQVKSHD